MKPACGRLHDPALDGQVVLEGFLQGLGSALSGQGLGQDDLVGADGHDVEGDVFALMANIRKAKAESTSPLDALHWLYTAVMKFRFGSSFSAKKP